MLQASFVDTSCTLVYYTLQVEYLRMTLENCKRIFTARIQKSVRPGKVDGPMILEVCTMYHRFEVEQKCYTFVYFFIMALLVTFMHT